MTHFDWEMQDQYDKDFIQGLELIKRIDLAQFVIDLSINDKATFELLRTLMNNQVMNRQVNENRNY
jgi:hypothetical protein